MLMRRFIAFISKIKNRKRAKIALSAEVDWNTKFEGENFVGRKAVITNSSLGRGSYVANNSEIVNAFVGRYSCIGSRVYIIRGNHPISFASMHPFFYTKKNQIGITYVTMDKFQEFSYVDSKKEVLVEIGNDVWIGSDARIMSGIHIGDGAIVAAGALVTKNVPPYAIVGGVPAKIIRFRFDEERINQLMSIRWWEKDINLIRKNADYYDDIDKFCDKMNNETRN